MVLLLAALFGGLYALARFHTTPRAAFVGAVAGTLSTSVAELIGWQGGATLTGLVGTVYALVFLEQWLRVGGRRNALLTGAAYAAIVASHPFMTAVATGLLGLRWLAGWYESRHLSLRGWSPLGLQGILLGATLPVLTMLVLVRGYTSGLDAPSGSGLRLPQFDASLQQLTWITRESPDLLVVTVILLIAALIAPLAIRSIAFGVALIFVALPAVLSGDPSYQSRVVYILPIALALGGAWLWRAVDGWLPARTASHVVGRVGLVAAPALAATLIVALGFAHRLPAAAAYYPQLQASNVGLLKGLANGSGTVLTSWTSFRYWDGMGKSWYVEGLSGRTAIGPTDPSLSVRPAERNQAAAAWQLFSGAQGLQNGALQVSLGPPKWHADPAIAAMIAGNYVPLVYINDAVNRYAAAQPLSPMTWTTNADGSASGSRALAGSTAVSTSATLGGSTVDLTWTRAAATTGAWTIYVWPQYGAHWSDVQASAQQVVITPQGGAALHSLTGWNAADPKITIVVGGSASLRYVPIDTRFNLQAIAIDVPPGSNLAMSISVTGTSAPSAVQSFDERTLLAQEHVATAVMWRSTLWSSRFTTDPCWIPGAADAQIQTFDVSPACAPATK
jgi:hypothetical protein